MNVFRAMPERAYPPQITPPPYFKRDYYPNCDGFHSCPIVFGTCYSEDNGSGYEYIGCCSVNSCAARTTCINYQSGDPDPNSICTDVDKGGCTTCTNQFLPACVTIVNTYEDQYLLYCDTSLFSASLGWSNPVPPSPSSSQASTTPFHYITLSFQGRSSSTSEEQTSTSSRLTGQTISPTTDSALPSITAGSGILNASATQAQDSSLSQGAIAGIAVAGAFGLAFLIVFLCLALHKGRMKKWLSSFTKGLNGKKNRSVPSGSQGMIVQNQHLWGRLGGNAAIDPISGSDEKALPKTDEDHNAKKMSYIDNSIQQASIAEAPNMSSDGMGMLRYGAPSSTVPEASRGATSMVSVAPTTSLNPHESVCSGLNMPQTPEMMKLAAMPTPNGSSIPMEVTRTPVSELSGEDIIVHLDNHPRHRNPVHSFGPLLSGNNTDNGNVGLARSTIPNGNSAGLAIHPASLLPARGHSIYPMMNGFAGSDHPNANGPNGASPPPPYQTPERTPRNSQASTVSAHVYNARSRTSRWPSFLWRPEYMTPEAHHPPPSAPNVRERRADQRHQRRLHDSHYDGHAIVNVNVRKPVYRGAERHAYRHHQTPAYDLLSARPLPQRATRESVAHELCGGQNQNAENNVIEHNAAAAAESKGNNGNAIDSNGAVYNDEWAPIQSRLSMPQQQQQQQPPAQSMVSTIGQESLGSGHELDRDRNCDGDHDPVNLDARGGVGYVTPEQAHSWRWTGALGSWLPQSRNTSGRQG